VGCAEYKAPKGVIRVALDIENGRISRASITGDFFMYPEEALIELENGLLNVRAERNAVEEAVRRFYERTGARTPMVEAHHWVEALMRAVNED